MDEGDRDKSWDDIDAGWGDVEKVKESAPEDRARSKPKKKHSWMAEKREETQPPSADEDSHPTLQAIEAVAPDADKQPKTEDDPDDSALEEAESNGPTRPGHDEVDLMAQPIQFEEHKLEDEEGPRERHTRDTARLRRISDSVEALPDSGEEGASEAEPSKPLVVRPPAATNIPSALEPAADQPKSASTGSRQALIIFAVLVVLAIAAVVAVVVTALG